MGDESNQNKSYSQEANRASLSPMPQLPGKLLLSIWARSARKSSIVASSHPSSGHFLCKQMLKIIKIHRYMLIIIYVILGHKFAWKTRSLKTKLQRCNNKVFKFGLTRNLDQTLRRVVKVWSCAIKIPCKMPNSKVRTSWDFPNSLSFENSNFSQLNVG